MFWDHEVSQLTTDLPIVLLGTPRVLHRILHRGQSPRPSCPPAPYISRAGLRRCPLLRHELVRPLFPWRVVLSAGGLLLLVLLLFHELYLACGWQLFVNPGLYPYSILSVTDVSQIMCTEVSWRSLVLFEGLESLIRDERGNECN
jgi:hypothetical protein